MIQHLQRQGQASELIRSIYMQELNRVRYMMRGYLRCRLLKIEKYVMHILDNEEEQDKLSPPELQHAQVRKYPCRQKHWQSSCMLSKLRDVVRIAMQQLAKGLARYNCHLTACQLLSKMPSHHVIAAPLT